VSRRLEVRLGQPIQSSLNIHYYSLGICWVPITQKTRRKQQHIIEKTTASPLPHHQTLFCIKADTFATSENIHLHTRILCTFTQQSTSINYFLKITTHRIYAPRNSGVDTNQMCAGGGHGAPIPNFSFFLVPLSFVVSLNFLKITLVIPSFRVSISIFILISTFYQYTHPMLIQMYWIFVCTFPSHLCVVQHRHRPYPPHPHKYVLCVYVYTKTVLNKNKKNKNKQLEQDNSKLFPKKNELKWIK